MADEDVMGPVQELSDEEINRRLIKLLIEEKTNPNELSGAGIFPNDDFIQPVPRHGLLGQLYESATARDPRAPWIGDVKKRLISGALQGAAGAPNPWGMGFGAVNGLAFPAQDAGALTENIVSQLLGRYVPLDKMSITKHPIMKPAVTGLAGAATDLLGQGASSVVGEGRGIRPEEALLTGGLGTILGLSVEAPAALAKYARARKIARDISGLKIKPEEVQELQADLPAGVALRDLGLKQSLEEAKKKGLFEGYRTKIQDIQGEARDLRRRLQGYVGIKAARQAQKVREIGQVDEDILDAETNLQFWQNKADELAKKENTQAASWFSGKHVKPWEDKVAELKNRRDKLTTGQLSETVNRAIETTNQNARRVKDAISERLDAETTLQNELDYLGRNYTSPTALSSPLKEALDKSNTGPRLVKFFYGSDDPTQGHIKEFMSVASPAGKKAMKLMTTQAWLQSLFKEGLPTERSLQQTNSNFSFAKLVEAFGGHGSKDAVAKARAMSQIAEDVTLANRGNLGRFTSWAANRVPVALAYGMIPIVSSGGGDFAKASLIAGGALAGGILVDELIQGITRIRGLGPQFHTWATKGQMSRGTLKYFPTLYHWMQEHEVQIPSEAPGMKEPGEPGSVGQP